uniref:NFKB inhibitor interacting Ras-like 1 n=1 Tax=Sinocyclocheilus rhinocerous TaxID=307959 RepID=A0A673MZZ8_9TELE
MGKGCKVVVCGMASVGKTAILEQLLYGSHTVGVVPSDIIDIYLYVGDIMQDLMQQLRLYDTRGLREGQDLPKHFFSAADGFVLDYSVDSLESFRRVELLKKEIDKSRDKKEKSKHFSIKKTKPISEPLHHDFHDNECAILLTIIRNLILVIISINLNSKTNTTVIYT